MDLFIHHQSHILSLSPISSPPPTFSSSLGVDLVGNRISPSILLIIVIVAVIFFLSGILHLLVRYLLRPNAYRDADDTDNTDAVTSHQGQLQQLFHLHDCGVDQSFIDTLPVFPYKAIIGGVKDPFDCAVCLCEFEADDKLRLLPKCSHAFHVECIDTWLLSHSTCPLCRSTLQSSTDTRCRSQILVLIESESSREVASSDDTDTQEETQRAAEEETETETETKVVQVKLGKFKGVEGSSNVVDNVDRRLDQRRCFSMGTYEYVMNDNSLLRVAIKPSKKRPPGGIKRQRLAMSECDCHSRRGFGEECIGNARISGSSTGKRESFSVSKIWLRAKKEKQGTSCEGGSCSSRRAFSFRLPALLDESKAKSAVSPRTTVSEFGVGMWEKDGSEMDVDVEVGSCNNSIVSMGSQIEQTPSFARRTLLWIVGNGRQNRVGSMS